MTRCFRLVFVGALLASLGAVAASADSSDKRDDTMQKKFERFCSRKDAPAAQRLAERLTGRLDLSDTQKPALNEFREAFAKSIMDGRAALCSTKPNFATTPGRFAFAKNRIEVRFEQMKFVEPKLAAFYNVLDDKQKAAMDEMRLWSPRKKRHGKEEPEKTERHDNDDDDK